MTNKNDALDALNIAELHTDAESKTYQASYAQVKALLALSDSLDSQVKSQNTANKVALLATGMLARYDAETMVTELLEELRS